MAKHHDGHRARTKEEYRKHGLEHFPHHKKLELLLYYAISRRDTNIIGHQLMERFGSLSGVFDADYGMLMEVEGIGEESATLLKLVSDLILAYMNDRADQINKIDSIETAKKYVENRFLNEQKECVYLMCMGMDGKVLYSGKIARGEPDMVNVAPADVATVTIRANAKKIIMAHNHPHGICIPSRRDSDTTKILHSALRPLNLELVDHIIVAPDGVYSMRENKMSPFELATVLF